MAANKSLSLITQDTPSSTNVMLVFHSSTFTINASLLRMRGCGEKQTKRVSILQPVLLELILLYLDIYSSSVSDSESGRFTVMSSLAILTGGSVEIFPSTSFPFSRLTGGEVDCEEGNPVPRIRRSVFETALGSLEGSSFGPSNGSACTTCSSGRSSEREFHHQARRVTSARKENRHSIQKIMKVITMHDV